MGKTFVGIDLGSTTVKAVAVNGKVIASAIKPTGANPRKTGEAVLEQVLAWSRGDVQKAHAKGSYSLFPHARTIIDIGGQDSKITRINEQGKVLDFAMNDKCAAGTGRFIENTARALEISLLDFSNKSLVSRRL